MIIFCKQSFWIISVSLIVISVLYCIVTCQTSWRTLTAALLGPIAVTSVLFTSKPIGERLLPEGAAQGGTDGATNVVFALFSIAGTLIAGYAFYTVNRFSRQRRTLKKSIANAEAASAAARRDAESVTEQYSLLQKEYLKNVAEQKANTAQLTAFLDLQGQLRSIGQIHTIVDQNRFADLKLLESLLLRHEWKRLVFDLRELVCIVAQFPGRVPPAPLVKIYLGTLKDVSEGRVVGTGEDRDTTLGLVEQALRMLS